MQEINHNKQIYLSGGGNEHQSLTLDKFFFNTIKSGGKFLYIPIALRGHKLFPTANLWMDGILKLHNRTDITFEVMDNPSEYTQDDLEKFDAVYVGGGNTWSLIQELKESEFSELLISYIESGKIMYGGSAGAIILGKRIDTHDDENKQNSKDVEGFDKLSGYSITCHFKIEDGDRFQSWAVLNKLPIICLPEETGLIVVDNIATCVGEKPCQIYKADGSSVQVLPKETFSI
ncbi:MAG: Type 1 glutamine amidotransferase-like domain-containing protein [Candidatus Pacebacteria bacterium]|nr:Type 1 glutamine amidotransferase-like domain-containing protein [Candidatus Paceibacterota bacterium]